MKIKYLALACSAFVLAACGGGSGEDDAVAGITTGGTVSLSMGDAPVDDVSKVYLTISAVEFGGDDGSTSDVAADSVTLSPPVTLNLLDYQNGEYFALFTSKTVDAGNYSWVRLKLDSDNPPEVVDDSGTHTLTIPSGSQTGIKLHGSGNLLVGSSSVHQYAIDLDLHRSLKQTGNGAYKLRPSYRLIDLTANLWRLSGNISVSRPVGCNGAIYVFKGSVTPDDIENPDDGVTITGTNSSDSVEPMIVEVVGTNTQYTIEDLTTGTYTVAFTCDVANDDPDKDDAVSFLGSEVVSVNSDTLNVTIN